MKRGVLTQAFIPGTTRATTSISEANELTRDRNFKQIVFPFAGNCCVEYVISLHWILFLVLCIVFYFLAIVFLLVSLLLSTAQLQLPVTWSQWTLVTSCSTAVNGVTFVPGLATASPICLCTSVFIEKVPVVVYSVVFLMIEAIINTIVVCMYRWYITEQISRKQNILKWIGYSLSAPFMTTGIAHMTLTTDLSLLFGVWIMTSATMYFGWCLDVMPNSTHKRITNLLGWIPLATVWILIFIGTFRIPSKDVPAFIYAVVIFQFINFCSFGINMFLYLYNVYGPIDSAQSYARYTAIDTYLSFSAKVVLPSVVFSGSLVNFF